MQQKVRQHCSINICSYFGWLWQIQNLRWALSTEQACLQTVDFLCKQWWAGCTERATLTSDITWSGGPSDDDFPFNMTDCPPQHRPDTLVAKLGPVQRMCKAAAYKRVPWADSAVYHWLSIVRLLFFLSNHNFSKGIFNISSNISGYVRINQCISADIQFFCACAVLHIYAVYSRPHFHQNNVKILTDSTKWRFFRSSSQHSSSSLLW